MRRIWPVIVLASLIACIVSIFSIGYSCGELHFIQDLKVDRIECNTLVVATLDGEEYVFGIH